MLCHQQVAQLRDALSELLVLTDPERRAYRSLGLRDDLAASVKWATVRNSARAFRAGFRQERTQGSPWQQGGVFVLGPGPETRFAYVSQAGGDHPPVDEVLAALPAG